MRVNLKLIRLKASQEETKFIEQVNELKRMVDYSGSKSPFLSSTIQNIDNLYHNYHALLKAVKLVEDQY